jgi:hypothetical protein
MSFLDYLAVAALFISAVTLVVNVLLYLWSDIRSVESNELASIANKKSDEANRIAIDANNYARASLDLNKSAAKKEFNPKIILNIETIK